MPAAEAYLVEEMAPSGVEMVVGGYRHARFGPVLMAGFGGVFWWRFWTISLSAFARLIGRTQTRCWQGSRARGCLAGYRGAAPVDREALLDVMMAVGGPERLANAARGNHRRI